MLVAGDDDIGSEFLNDSPARWVLLRPFIRWETEAQTNIVPWPVPYTEYMIKPLTQADICKSPNSQFLRSVCVCDTPAHYKVAKT